MNRLAVGVLALSALLSGPVPTEAGCRDIGKSTFHCDPPPRVPSFSARPRITTPSTRPYRFDYKSRSLPGGTFQYKYRDNYGSQFKGTIHQSPYGRTWHRGTIR